MSNIDPTNLKFQYRVNGQLHREDGPAVEYNNGTKYWIIKDKNHRSDGPAVEWFNGRKSYYYYSFCPLGGGEISQTEYKIVLRLTKYMRGKYV